MSLMHVETESVHNTPEARYGSPRSVRTLLRHQVASLSSECQIAKHVIILSGRGYLRVQRTAVESLEFKIIISFPSARAMTRYELLLLPVQIMKRSDYE